MGLFALAMILGAFMMFYGIPPADSMRNAFFGGMAYLEKQSTNRKLKLHGDQWKDSRFEKSGVTIHNIEKSYYGYTLVTNGAFNGAWLLDMKGKVVHQWKAPFRIAFPASRHIVDSVKESRIYWRKAWLFPNGDLLGIYEALGDTPYGYGLVKVDKNSNVLWGFSDNIHHDLWVADDGKIYALAHRIQTSAPSNMQFINPPFLEDFIVILSPDGKELDRINILEAIEKSEYASMLYRLKLDWQYNGDFLHTNTVRIVPESLDGKLPFLKKGLIIIASRNMNFVGLIDPGEKKLVWSQNSFWAYLHDPEFTESGTVMLFDNTGDFIATQSSRILEYDPMEMKIVWEWNGDKDRPLISLMRGCKQRLRNGNILVTESDGGRLIEVTREKEVVWEYINTERRMLDGDEKIAVLSGARRYTRAQLPFLAEP